MHGFRYTIGTENKNKEALLKTVEFILPCFTVTEGKGSWKYSREDSLTFDFTLEGNEFDADAKANFVASKIRAFNSQEAVILIKQAVEVFYIYT